MNLVKKISIFALTLATVVSMAGFQTLRVEAAGSYPAGTLLAKANTPGAAVYYVGTDGKKYVFPDTKTYFTWYENFDSVVKVSVTELDMYTNGGAVTVRPGTKLVKTSDTAKVFAIEPGGVARHIPTAAIASSLFGANWASRVVDLIPGFFSSYPEGTALSTTLPTGTLVKDGTTYYYIDNGTKRAFSSMDAFEANNFNLNNVLNMSLASYTAGTAITGAETALKGFMAAAGGNQTNGTVTVSLASDTPSAGIMVNNAARVPFTKVKLVTGSQGVTIDTITVKRTGLAQDGAFASIDILDADTMLPFDNNSKTFNSTHTANFTKDIVIPANTTKYILLTGNAAADLTNYAGEAPALAIDAITLVGGGSVSGSFPLSGNTMTTNSTISIGTAIIQRGAYGNATSTAIEVGKTDYTFFSFQVEAGSVEDVTFSQVSVYQQGTATLGSDLSGIELFLDGTKVATGVVNDEYVNFTLTSPLTIPKGQTKQFQVKADVVDGSARTIDFGIYRATDLLVKGQTYNYNITPTYSGTGSSANSPVLSENQFTISTGTMTVERSSTVGSENIALGNNQTLGAFKFTTKGETIDVSSLTLTIVSSSAATVEDALQSVKLVDANGATVAGPTDVTTGTTNVTFTDTFTLPVGDTVLTVVANLYNSGGWATNDTIYARINTPATKITAKGNTTGQTITPSTTSLIDTNTQTIKGAYLAVTKDTLPASGTVIAGTQDVLLGAWTFDATNSGEDIRVTSIALAASSTDAVNLTLFNGTTALSPINEAPTAADNATSTFALETPIVITKGSSATIKLYGDINSNATENQSAQFGITDSATSNNASVVAYGVSTGLRAYTAVTADNGATLTYSSAGSITVSTYNNPNKAIVRAGATGVTFGYVKLDATSENLDLDQLKVYVADGAITGTADGNYQDVITVYVYDGSTLLASHSVPATGLYTFDFANGTLTVPADGSKVLTLKADIGAISSSADNSPATPAADIALGLGGTDGFKFTGNSSNTTATETYNGATTSAMVLHKALPTVTYSTTGANLGAATSLTSGAQNLFAFNVAADANGNEVLLYRASFELATGGASGDYISLTSCYLKDAQGNTIGAAVTPTDVDASVNNKLSFTFNNPNVSAGDDGEAISVAAGNSATFTLNCTVGGTGLGAGDYVAVSLLGDTTSSTPAASHGTPAAAGQNKAAAWGAYNQGNFVWSDNYKNRGLATDGANATAWGQWYNGYLVSGLGTLTTTTAYTVSWSS